MKFTIDHSVLSNALSHVQNVVEKKNTNPLLSNVKITAIAGEGLVLNATDNEIEISEKIAANVEEDGVITASAHKLYEVVRKLPSGSEIAFVLNAENQQIKLSAGRAKFSLPTMSGDDFPSISEGEMNNTFTTKASTILTLFMKTSFAVATDESRFYLNGIYFHEAKSHAEDGSEKALLRAVATDGHRLACAETDLPVGAEGMNGIIIPRKTIGELTKLLAYDGDVTVSLSSYKIRFVIGNLVLTSLLIEGSYPDYERVIPLQNDKKIQIDAKQLATVVDRVSAMCEKSRSVSLTFSSNNVLVAATNDQEGSAHDEMEAAYSGEDLKIGFNFVYLGEVLKQIESGQVEMSLSDEASPALLRDLADGNVLYVMMPMRV
ncbi:MAG: DNA polymerase III subunit beta [Alphaproteobacteria bacterium]|nr:DNA polymerase III subunit beta [Alphaproteobacteria bacterium]